MPRVIITERARLGLARCRLFLLARNRVAARRAGQVIDRQFALLRTSPDIGRPCVDMPGLRELIVRFGNSGYVALYRHDPAADAVYVLAFRHQREAGYGP